jgi:prepilin-type N-terminal cleavage/methylation domain-containing protein
MFKKNIQKSGHFSRLKFFLLTRLTNRKKTISSQGYTLIELLVAMIIAVLVISPLLGLAVNLLQTDRQEQAKATSEEELQLAADYIARDLKQAVYIYDGEALENNNIPTDGAASGIKNQIPPLGGVGGLFKGCETENLCQPVLAFWKRKPFTDILPQGGTTNCTTNPDGCDDTFVFSFVTYYLIREDPNATPDTGDAWSNTARIARFEIHDRVAYVDSNGNTQEPEEASDGFNMFDLSLGGSDLEGKMNRWVRNTTANYDSNDMQVLIDYVDQTPANNPAPNAPPTLASCPDDTDTNGDLIWDTTPSPQTKPADFPNSFYVCVNVRDTAAIIYLRGNALARIRSESNTPLYTANRGRAGYFPSTETEVQSIGRLIQ